MEDDYHRPRPSVDWKYSEFKKLEILGKYHLSEYFQYNKLLELSKTTENNAALVSHHLNQNKI